MEPQLVQNAMRLQNILVSTTVVNSILLKLIPKLLLGSGDFDNLISI